MLIVMAHKNANEALENRRTEFGGMRWHAASVVLNVECCDAHVWRDAFAL